VNRTRLAIVVSYDVAIASACLWVPWLGPAGANLTKFLGYGWIWSGPTGALTPEYYKLSTIDFGRFALEVLALTAIFGIAFLATLGTNVITAASVWQSEPAASGVWTPPRLPDPSNMPEGRIALDPKTRKPLAKVQGGKWVPP